MELDARLVAKIDPLLQELLSQAKGEEEIRAIVVLDADAVQVGRVLSPSEFPSRQAYREALLAQRREQMGGALAETLHQLRALSLKTTGDAVSPVVMVEGSAKQWLQALTLPGVRHANLDQLIGAPQIAPPEQVDYLANLYQQVLGQELDAKTQDLIVRACEQYLLQYYQRYGKLQVLGMPKPVELESIFTAVQCLEQPDYFRLESEYVMQAAFRQAGKRGFQSRKTLKIDGMVIANAKQNLMVLGAPGAGKSTFLRKLGLEAFKGKEGDFYHNCFPVILELKRLTDDEIDLERLIIRELQERQLPLAKEFIERALMDGKLLLLLDGLDEVPTKNQEQAIFKIRKFAEDFPKNRFITSCRVAAYRQNFRRFISVEIAEFDDGQVHQFIQNWFSLEADHQAHTAEACWALLNQSHHSATKELARNPLLLTFLCLVYDRSQDFPSNRSTLYSKALDILLEQWWSQKRVNNIEPIYQKLGIELEKAMLAEIAYESFSADRLFFPRQQLVDQIQRFLNRQAQTSDLKAEFVLDSIAIQQGIWVERARNVYSFSHLTFQEYLTSQYIYDQNQVEAFVLNSLTDSRWREVFLLISGLMRGGSDKFLLQIESHSKIYSAKIKALFDWTDRITSGSEANCKPATRRILALALALVLTLKFTHTFAPILDPILAINQALTLARALTRARARARAVLAPTRALDSTSNLDVIILNRTPYYAFDQALDFDQTLNFSQALDQARDQARDLDQALDQALDLDQSLDRALDQACAYEEIKIFKAVNFADLITKLTNLRNKVPVNGQPLKARRKFRNLLLDIWFDILHLDSQLVELSGTEVEAIQAYLSATQLMIDCQKSAITVSKETWTAIEDRILKWD